MQPSRFSAELIEWWRLHKRDLPWKQTRDPYKIWISEIILQQTRVAQGLKYYNAFLSTFPTVFELAAASEPDVMKAWEGLGYYQRARNLHATAKEVAYRFSGIFPDTLEGLLALKGVGPYTAAAIASFAYGLPHPVVDGNVLRIVSRILAITDPIHLPAATKPVKGFLERAIRTVLPEEFNQALMDFGSLVCIPGRPLCESCPMALYCRAYQEGQAAYIPVRKKKTPLTERYFHFFDTMLPEGKTIVQRRDASDIWPGLYQIPCYEASDGTLLPSARVSAWMKEITGAENIVIIDCVKSLELQQVLSHQRIYGYFYKLTLNELNIQKKNDVYLEEREKVSKFAFPKIVLRYYQSTRSDYPGAQTGNEGKTGKTNKRVRTPFDTKK